MISVANDTGSLPCCVRIKFPAARVSRSMRDTACKVLQVKEKLTAETGREPDVETIAKALDIA